MMRTLHNSAALEQGGENPGDEHRGGREVALKARCHLEERNTQKRGQNAEVRVLPAPVLERLDPQLARRDPEIAAHEGTGL